VSVPEPGRPWAAGDLLVRWLPPGWGVPAGWTMVSEDARYGLVIWRLAEQVGAGEPDVYVATPVLHGGGPDGTAVTWDGSSAGWWQR